MSDLPIVWVSESEPDTNAWLGVGNTGGGEAAAIRWFGTLNDAAECLYFERSPCLVAIDHDAPLDSESRIGLALDRKYPGVPSALAFAAEFRTRHPHGLALPIAYVARNDNLTDDAWLESERTLGALHPTLLLRPPDDASASTTLAELRRLSVIWNGIAERVGRGSMEPDAFDRDDASLPIALVDDQQDQFLNVAIWLLENAYPERTVHTFTTVASAWNAMSEGNLNHDPFLLILDHDMQENASEELKAAMNIPADSPVDNAYGWLLARQLRLHHPWGLALPICYYSANAQMSNASQWVNQERSQPGLSPSLYYSKRDKTVDQVVPELDQQFDQTLDLFQALVVADLLNSAFGRDDA